MSHKGIRAIIEKAAKSLRDDIEFSYGRTSDFNLIRDKQYPFITCDTLTCTAGFTDNNVLNYVKIWSVSMAFYMLDKESSIAEEYALILDDTDYFVDGFIQKINNVLNDEDGILILNINQQAFIKATADILTGHLLNFQIQVPDNWNYCRDC
jgi:hypothetical protein